MAFRTIYVVIGLGAAWWCFFAASTGLLLEDALITYRHVTNLLAGNGFVFNPGEWVLGSTSPGQGMLLSLVGLVIGPDLIPVYGPILMTIAGIATGYVLYRLLQTAGCTPLICALATILFYGSTRIMVTSVGGMETPLVLLVMMLSLLNLVQGRYTTCVSLLAVLLLLRPDGALWAAVVGTGVVCRRRAFPWREIIVALLILLPWIIYSSLAYGSPVPHTIAAKHAIGPATLFLPRLSATAWRHFAVWYASATGFAPNGLVLTLIGAGAFSFVARRRTRLVGVVLCLFVALYGATLYVGRAPHFTWYLTPVAICCVVFYAAGADGAGRLMTRGLSCLGHPLNVTPVVAMTLVVLPCLVMNQGVLQKYRETQANELGTRRAVGEWLQAHTQPDESVATEAIGYQGFYSKRRIIDLAGLVTPAVVSLAVTSATNAELFERILTTLEPDWLVLRSYEVDRNQHFYGGPLFENSEQTARFHDRYSEVKRFTAPYPARWQEQSYLTIYRRKQSSRQRSQEREECPQTPAAPENTITGSARCPKGDPSTSSG